MSDIVRQGSQNLSGERPGGGRTEGEKHVFVRSIRKKGGGAQKGIPTAIRQPSDNRLTIARGPSDNILTAVRQPLDNQCDNRLTTSLTTV